MQPAKSLVDLVSVRTPCTESWDAMRGDDRKRFCDKCRLHVYDISAMTRPEAEAILATQTTRAASDGGPGETDRLCVRFARRPDGTVVTQDCGSFLKKTVRRAIRRRAIALRTAAASILALFFPLAACSQPAPTIDVQGSPVPPPERIAGEVELGDFRPPEMGKPSVPPSVPK